MITIEQIRKIDAKFFSEKRRCSKIIVLIGNWVSFTITLLLTSYLLREPMSILLLAPAAIAMFFVAGLFIDDWYDEESPTFGVDEEANFGCFATAAIPFFLLLAGYAASQIKIHSSQLLLLPALAIIVAVSYVYLKRHLSKKTYPYPFNCFSCCMKSEFGDTKHCPFCGFETKAKNQLDALKQHAQRMHPEITKVSSLTERQCSKCPR